MVRINLINPKNLADQHLVAEYNEILMLAGHVRKFPLIKNQPKNYCLGKGHINFFKNKLKYLKKRHEKIKFEMKQRGFKIDKSLNLIDYEISLRKDWKANDNDKEIIKNRLIDKIKLKPFYYRYYGIKMSKEFFIKLIEKG